MSVNLTVCPKCGGDMDTVAEHKELPIQVLQQECDCGYEVGIAIMNYPNGTYEVIGPALKGDICSARINDPGRLGVRSCGDDAMIRVDEVRKPMKGRCPKHMREHRRTAMELRSKL